MNKIPIKIIVKHRTRKDDAYEFNICTNESEAYVMNVFSKVQNEKKFKSCTAFLDYCQENYGLRWEPFRFDHFVCIKLDD